MAHRHSACSEALLITCLAAFLLKPIARIAAQDTSTKPEQMVGMVRDHRMLSKTYATAWCLNTDCDWAITNYHVANVMGKHMTIKGVKVKRYVFATDGHDPEAKSVASMRGPIRLAPYRDIAFLFMAEPLSHKGMQTVPFYAGDLEEGQPVTVIGYPGGTLTAIKGKFAGECEQGELKFELNHKIAEGASGGLIVDQQGRAVGLAMGASEDRMAVFAVPVWAIAEFMHTSDINLFLKVFPTVNVDKPEPVTEFQTHSANPDESFSPTPLVSESSLTLKDVIPNEPIARYDASMAVLLLRKRAEVAAQKMKNFVARQTLLFPTGRAWQHEVQVVEGRQHFRTLPDGKDLMDLPIPRDGPVPGSHWADLINVVAADLRLAVQFNRETHIDGHRIKVFHYRAGAQDQICGLKIRRRFWGGARRLFLPCTGSIWTDEAFDVLRVTQDMIVPEYTGVVHFRVVVLYGRWDEKLVPVSIYLNETQPDGRILASRVRFDKYRVFRTTTRIAFRGKELEKAVVKGAH
ncbi:MAG: S1 family peptidase [Terriglobales bacterium]